MSTKQKLISRLTEEEERLATDLFIVRTRLGELRDRGSGPLPYWAKDLARRLGIS